jgi:hypothetical protein
LLQDFLIILSFLCHSALDAVTSATRRGENPESLLFYGFLLEFTPGFPLSRNDKGAGMTTSSAINKNI